MTMLTSLQATIASEEPKIDPVALHARLMALRAEYERTKIFQAPENAPDLEISRLRESHSARIASMIEEQIDIIAKLRRTATGPAKKGGKRAKSAPPAELSSLLND